MEPLHKRIPDQLHEQLTNISNIYLKNLQQNPFQWEIRKGFPTADIHNRIAVYRASLEGNSTELNAFDALVLPLKEVVNRYSRHTDDHAVQVISDLLVTFYEREKIFLDTDEASVIRTLRIEAPENLESVATHIRAHFQLHHREKVIMELLTIVERIFRYLYIIQHTYKTHTHMYAFIALKDMIISMNYNRF